MKKKPFSKSLIPVCLFLVLGGLGLSSCAPPVVAEGRPTPNSSPTLAAYPPPVSATPRPLPTRADGKIDRFSYLNSLLVTPLPDEKLMVSNIVLIKSGAIPTPVPPRYSILNERKGEGVNRVYMLLLHDSQTGTDIRLGDDAGSAIFGTMNDEYILWRCAGCAELQTGFYAYRLATSQEILISNSSTFKWYSQIDGQWVIYREMESANPTVSDLRAHNLITGEDFLVASDVFYPFAHQGIGPLNPSDYYIIRSDKIAWVAAKMENGLQLSMRLYDLTTRTTRTLNLPETSIPRQGWNIFGELVIWRDKFWQGYDLKRDAYFTIPVIPPGWEDVPIKDASLVTAKDNTLYWSLTVDDETHYFSAPILPKGQGPQPTHVVPTPHQKPTVSPGVITSTPIPPSTAYS
jgi:hypothetical protein